MTVEWALVAYLVFLAGLGVCALALYARGLRRQCEWLWGELRRSDPDGKPDADPDPLDGMDWERLERALAEVEDSPPTRLERLARWARWRS